MYFAFGEKQTHETRKIPALGRVDLGIVESRAVCGIARCRRGKASSCLIVCRLRHPLGYVEIWVGICLVRWDVSSGLRPNPPDSNNFRKAAPTRLVFSAVGRYPRRGVDRRGDRTIVQTMFNLRMVRECEIRR